MRPGLRGFQLFPRPHFAMYAFNAHSALWVHESLLSVFRLGTSSVLTNVVLSIIEAGIGLERSCLDVIDETKGSRGRKGQVGREG